nr:hypothetical protein [Pseudoxanthomonas winnipegensis]
MREQRQALLGPGQELALLQAPVGHQRLDGQRAGLRRVGHVGLGDEVQRILHQRGRCVALARQRLFVQTGATLQPFRGQALQVRHRAAGIGHQDAGGQHVRHHRPARIGLAMDCIQQPGAGIEEQFGRHTVEAALHAPTPRPVMEDDHIQIAGRPWVAAHDAARHDHARRRDDLRHPGQELDEGLPMPGLQCFAQCGPRHLRPLLHRRSLRPA